MACLRLSILVVHVRSSLAWVAVLYRLSHGRQLEYTPDNEQQGPWQIFLLFQGNLVWDRSLQQLEKSPGLRTS